MKDFEPLLAPPEAPDPWWKRLFAYTVISLVIIGVCVGGTVLYSYGLLEDGPSSFGPLKGMSVEEHNAYVKRNMWIGLGLGVFFSLSYCAEEEWRRLKKWHGGR